RFNQSLDLAGIHRHGAPPRGLSNMPVVANIRLDGSRKPLIRGPSPISRRRSRDAGVLTQPEAVGQGPRPAVPETPNMIESDLRKLRFARWVALAFCLGLGAGAANAQPTPEQQSAIRSACRADFMANCSGVTPGGRDALMCLQRNAAKLSPACQTALS